MKGVRQQRIKTAVIPLLVLLMRLDVDLSGNQMAISSVELTFK